MLIDWLMLPLSAKKKLACFVDKVAFIVLYK